MTLNNLKIPFKNKNRIETNYSQACQDLFVLSCLDGKDNGFFLELGCNQPIIYSNTYLLESKFNWNGISIDIQQHCVDMFKDIRKCNALCKDALSINYEELLKDKNHIDYLSLDLDPAVITLECLKKIPFNKIEFSVITYEHDYYRFKDYCRDESRKIFLENNYYLLASNVNISGLVFEDWYINIKYVDLNKVNLFKSENLESKNIIFY